MASVDALRRTEGRFEATRQQVALTPLVGTGTTRCPGCSPRGAMPGEGRGRVVLLRGEPGIGKSRLTHVLRERIAA